MNILARAVSGLKARTKSGLEWVACTEAAFDQHSEEHGCRLARVWAYRWGFALAFGVLLGLVAYGGSLANPSAFSNPAIEGIMSGCVGVFFGWGIGRFHHLMTKHDHLRKCALSERRYRRTSIIE